VPMFVRAGSIIPMGPEMKFVGEKPLQPSFVIYPDEEGKAAAILYEDDGLSPAYKEGVFRRTRIRVSGGGNEIRINVAEPEGTFKPAPRTLSFLIPTKLLVKKVSLDANPLPPAGTNGSAWYKSGDVLTIRIPDDGKPHDIEIK
jgi:alpha-glucosidase